MRPAHAALSRALLLALLVPASPVLAQHHGGARPALQVKQDAAHRDLVVEIGPVDLPVESGHLQLPALHARVPLEGWLHGYTVEMVDARGRAVPRRTLHHVNIIAPAQRELFSAIMLRVGAAGEETGPVTLPRLMGYRVHRGQPLIFTAMLHNPTPRAYHGVRLRIHFPYTTAAAVLQPVSVMPFYMDVMPPASLHSYDLPPGRSSRAWEARPAVAARILAIGGHLHPYGTSLRLEDVTAGETLWDGRPTLGPDGSVIAMTSTRYLWRMGVPLRPDHVYRVVAEYNNTSGAVIPGGAMGALGGVVVPGAEGRWPGVDPANPELRLDWQLVHTGNPGGHGHAHGAHTGGAMPGMAPARAAREHEAMSGHPHPAGSAGTPNAAKAHGSGAAARGDMRR
jgi:hypothetical protein